MAANGEGDAVPLRRRGQNDPGSSRQSSLGAEPRHAISSRCDWTRFDADLVDKFPQNGPNGAAKEFTKLRHKPAVSNEAESNSSSTLPVVMLACIFLGSLSIMGLIYLSFPELAVYEKQFIVLPKSIQDARNLGQVLSRYTDVYYYHVLFGYFITYIFLQSFAIPGSIFLSILSGYLFPFPLALFLVCLCSGVGASVCYFLSHLVGRRLVWKYIPERAAEWASHVERHKEHLLNYIIFLRITPFLPNWFINITSPVINVPITPFFLGTFIGVAPPSFVAIQAGTTLHQLASSRDTLSFTSVLVLAALAVISLLPVVFKSFLKKKFD